MLTTGIVVAVRDEATAAALEAECTRREIGCAERQSGRFGLLTGCGILPRRWWVRFALRVGLITPATREKWQPLVLFHVIELRPSQVDTFIEILERHRDAVSLYIKGQRKMVIDERVREELYVCCYGKRRDPTGEGSAPQ